MLALNVCSSPIQRRFKLRHISCFIIFVKRAYRKAESSGTCWRQRHDTVHIAKRTEVQAAYPAGCTGIYVV